MRATYHPSAVQRSFQEKQFGTEIWVVPALGLVLFALLQLTTPKGSCLTSIAYSTCLSFLAISSVHWATWSFGSVFAFWSGSASQAISLVPPSLTASVALTLARRPANRLNSKLILRGKVGFFCVGHFWSLFLLILKVSENMTRILAGRSWLQLLRLEFSLWSF